MMGFRLSPLKAGFIGIDLGNCSRLARIGLIRSNPVLDYFIFLGTTLISVFAYKVIPLSMGPILESTGYIYATIFGVLIFKEQVNRRQLVGLGLILLGIAVYALAG